MQNAPQSALDVGKLLRVAHQAAAAGGIVVMDHFRQGVAFRQKEPAGKSYDLVTQADLDAEQAIAQIVESHFPDHAMLGEESHQADHDAEHLWIIDPIDGTNNFAHRIPQFAVSVAYYYRGKAVVGVVLNPATDHCYAATVGGGATLNGQPIFVSPARSIDQAVVGTGFYYDRGGMMRATLDSIQALFEQHVHGIRRFGAASLDLCMVAAGQLDAYFEYCLAPWDFGAGRLIVEEAGGKVTTSSGTSLPIAKTPVLATNGHLHPALVATLEPFQNRW